ncbi:MAG: hypothetical protein QM770_20250 [Tepidisphaeraceae bacterium]
MTFRLGTLLAAIGITLLFYMAWIAILMNRMITICPVSSSRPADPMTVALWIAMAVCLMPSIVLFGIATVRMRRRHRPGFCSGCGRREEHIYARCAYCGTRTRVDRVVFPRGFEVIVRSKRSQPHYHFATVALHCGHG